MSEKITPARFLMNMRTGRARITQTHITSDASERARLKMWLIAIRDEFAESNPLASFMAARAINGQAYPTEAILDECRKAVR